MPTRRRGPSGPGFSIPWPSTPVRAVIIGMIVLYVVEMFLANLVLPSSLSPYLWLAWTPSLDVTLLWQPLTKYFVQGRDPFGVLLSLMVVWFFLPWAIDRFTLRDLGVAAASVVLGCVVAGMAWFGLNLAWTSLIPGTSGWTVGVAMGWQPFVVGLVASFCMAMPDQELNFMFVVKLQARWLFWLELGLISLFFLAGPSVATFEMFGAFGGIVAWWHLLGPGALRRRYRTAGRKVERGFQVITGGKQGGQRRRDDDTFH